MNAREVSNNKRKVGGAGRDRTGDLVNAIHARSQLRYSPTPKKMLSRVLDVVKKG
jgi:hypothetical protein